MNKKKLILLIIALIGVVSLTTTGILAWLTDSKTTHELQFTVGEVKFTWNPGTVKETPVVPGENVLLTPYTLTNSSTVATELRMQIAVVNQDNEDVLTDVVLTNGTSWSELESGYYYYRAGTPTSDNKYPIAVNQTSITVITGISLDGSVVGNDKANHTYTVTITFQAKQADYATWTDLGSVNFTTGLN